MTVLPITFSIKLYVHYRTVHALLSDCAGCLSGGHVGHVGETDGIGDVLRCSNLHIQLASEGFVDVRAEDDQAVSGAAVRLFSASRTLVGVAKCKQVDYATAWIINIDIDCVDKGTVDHQRFKCAPFTIPRARITFIDGGREATVTCCQDTRLTVASSFVPSQSIIV
eukprot:503766_1